MRRGRCAPSHSICPPARSIRRRRLAQPPFRPRSRTSIWRRGETKTRPALVTFPRLGFGGSTDWTQPFSAPLDRFYDSYLESKKLSVTNTISDFFVDFSLYPQIGSKGNPVWLAAYYPSATWQPFTDTAIGSREVNFTF